MTRAFFFVPNADGYQMLELEDPFFAQYTMENMTVYMEEKMYRVKEVKRVLIPSGRSVDSQVEIYLEQ